MSAQETIEMIRRIIADDTADLRERVQHLEQRTNGVDLYGPGSSDVDVRDMADDQAELIRLRGFEQAVEISQPRIDEMQLVLDQIKALHQLDATPVQYTRDPRSGKMVDAPEGLWEITCLACNHHAYFKEGESQQPPQCETWKLANSMQSNKP